MPTSAACGCMHYTYLCKFDKSASDGGALQTVTWRPGPGPHEGFPPAKCYGRRPLVNTPKPFPAVTIPSWRKLHPRLGCKEFPGNRRYLSITIGPLVPRMTLVPEPNRSRQEVSKLTCGQVLDQPKGTRSLEILGLRVCLWRGAASAFSVTGQLPLLPPLLSTALPPPSTTLMCDPTSSVSVLP